MTEATLFEQLDPDLNGLRIGLSGAIPEPGEWAGRALDWEILNAVSTLADTVFSGGGYLVHGSHPSFTPRILAQAGPYAQERGEPVVTFVLSGLFADTHLARQLREPRYQGVLSLLLVDPVIPAGHEGHGAEDPVVRNASLAAMREALIAEMDALVVIGGKRWAGSANKPGTLEELELACARGIPTFLLGGLGGMAADLASAQPRNRLTDGMQTRGMAEDRQNADAIAGEARTAFGRTSLTSADEALISTTTDYGRAISLISREISAGLLPSPLRLVPVIVSFDDGHLSDWAVEADLPAPV